MPAENEIAIAALLRETETAHGAYETDVLGGAFDENWPTWCASYLLGHGLGDYIGGAATLEVDNLAATLERLAADYDRERPVSPWPDEYARGIVAASRSHVRDRSLATSRPPVSNMKEQSFMSWRVSPVPSRLVLFVALSLGGLVTLGSAAHAATPVTQVASGLTNPRGLAFDEGTLYVAIAGRPGPHAGVAAVAADGCPVMVVDELPAYPIVFGGLAGVSDVAVLAGQRYLLLAGGDIDRGGMPNGLYRFDDADGLTLVADVSAFIRDNPVAERPPDYDTDGQPYAMLAMGDAFWATEGNSNQVLRLGLDGAVSRIADLSKGHPIPTGIAPASDGGAYVAFFTHAPYRDGEASVVQVAADGSVTEVWSGLTLVTALATGPDGSLYALEMATGIDPDDPASIALGSGKVVRQSGPQTAEDVVTGLVLPVAMEFGPDGALYVASPAFGADDGGGTVLRIDLTDGSPVGVPASVSPPPSPAPPCP